MKCFEPARYPAATVGAAVLAAACGIALASNVAVHGAQAPASAAAPTFNQDVAPILYARCVSCHRPNEIAPMSLVGYQDARPWARSIKTKVAAGEMPPWPADTKYGKFKNAHTLTEAEANKLIAWVDAGAPQGDGTPPAPPKFLDGWTSQMDRPPDQVIDAPLAFELPATGEIPIVRVWTKQPIGKERYLEAIEMRPTNRVTIHHASVFKAKLPKGANKIGLGEVWPGGPRVEGIPVLKNGTPAPLGASAESVGQPLVFYVPGGGFLRFPKGVAERLQDDDYLLWTFHLTTSGKVQQAGARIGLWFSKGEPDHEVVTWTVTDKVFVDGKEVPRDAGGPIIPNIPARASDFAVTGVMQVKEPVTLYALWPHMHVRGRDMTFILQDSKGREETLLSVPRYKFGWQFTYELATPLKIPAGSTIRAIAHYDNSSANPENPDPNQEVIWGPQATNEMFDPFVEIVYDRRRLEEPIGFIEMRRGGGRPDE